MHILYIHQHFALPTGTTGTRSYEFARRWVKAGHQVTIITGHYDIGGVKWDGKPIEIEGFKVIVAGTQYSNKQSPLSRILAFLGFMWFSFFAGMKQKNVDIVFATSTPMTVGVPAMLLKWFKGLPFVFEVRDQWPAIPIEMGYIRNPLFKAFLHFFEKRIYCSAAGIVGLSPGMTAGVCSVLGAKKSAAKPMVTVSNCSDLERFKPGQDGSAIRTKHGWKNDMVFIHVGAMGHANGLDFILDAAIKVSDMKDIQFILIGDGREKQRLMKRKQDENIENVQFLGSIPKQELPAYFAACDVSLVTFSDYPILEHNSANKFFDSISAGKPVILNYHGWQGDIIEKYNAGFSVPQYDMNAFVEHIHWCHDNRDQLPGIGLNARKMAEENFSRDNGAARILELLQNVNDKKK